MALTILNLADGSLAAALAVIYTAPALTKAVIRSASFCNATGAPVALTVKLMPRTAGTLRSLVNARTLAANETYLCPELINQVLEAGGTIQASGLAIEYSVSGTQVTNG